MRPEAKIEQAIEAQVIRAGGRYLRLRLPDGHHEQKGFPDGTILLPGGQVQFVEVKQPGHDPRREQDAWAERLMALGFKCYVVQRVDEVDLGS